MKSYVLRILISLDRFLNTVLGGHHNQTISGRLGFHESEGSKLASIACSVLSVLLLERNHCKICFENEKRMMENRDE